MAKFLTALKISKYDLVLLTAAMFWGASYLIAKELVAASSIFGMMSVRFTTAAVILLALWFIKPVKFTKQDLILGVVLGICLSTVMCFETSALSITSATNSGLIISLAIVFTPIIEGFWNRSHLPAPFFVATVGAVVGVALLVGGNGFQMPNLGDFLMFIAAILRAGYTTAQGKLTEDKPVSAYNLTVINTATAGIIFFIVDAPGTINAYSVYDLFDWSLMTIFVLGCTVFGFWAMIWSIRATSASRVSLLTGTEPIWAVAIAVLFGGEHLAWLGVLGAVLIIASSYWGQGIEAKHRGQCKARDLELSA